MTTELETKDGLDLIEANIFVGDPFPGVPIIQWWKFFQDVPDYFGDVPDDWCDYWVGRTGELDKPSEDPKPVNNNRPLCKKCFRTVRNRKNGESRELCHECEHRRRKKEVISQEVRTVCSTCMVNVPEKGKTCDDCKEDRRRYGERVKAEKAAAKAARQLN